MTLILTILDRFLSGFLHDVQENHKKLKLCFLWIFDHGVTHGSVCNFIKKVSHSMDQFGSDTFCGRVKFLQMVQTFPHIQRAPLDVIYTLLSILLL